MKNVKQIKLVLIILITIITLINLSSRSLATSTEISTSSEIMVGKVDTNSFKPGELTEDDYKEAFNMTSTIVGAITTVGVVIAVVGIIVLGLKYMMGTIQEKAEYKKTMIPYLVGCILIFCASTIVSIIYGLVSQL